MGSKITIKLVRGFGVGFDIHSPALNGLSFDIKFGCFYLSVWNRPKKWFGYANYWNSQN